MNPSNLSVFSLFLLLGLGSAFSCDTAAKQMGPTWTCPKEHLLGSGSLGEVHLIQNPAGEKAVVKIVSNENPDKVLRLKEEYRIISKLDHPNIIKVLKLTQDTTHTYLFEEHGSRRDLKSFLKSYNRPVYNQRLMMKIFRGILEGVKYLHSQGLVHADLKLRNIVLSSAYVPKLIDFDLVNPINREGPCKGSYHYMDPRMLLHNECYFDEKVDVYSLGVVLYALGHGGAVPFPESDLEKLKKHVNTGDYQIEDYTELYLAAGVSGCLQEKAQSRINLRMLIDLVDIYFSINREQLVSEITLTNKRRTAFKEFTIAASADFDEPVQESPAAPAKLEDSKAALPLSATKNAALHELPKSSLEATPAQIAKASIKILLR